MVNSDSVIDLAQYNLLFNAQALSFLSAAFMAVALWEYLIWMPNEWHAWRKAFGYVKDSHGRKLRITLGECVAIFLRYALLGTVIAVGILDFGRPGGNGCQVAGTLTWVFSTLCWAGVSFLFTLRLYVMWQQNRYILAFFSLLWLISLGIWIASDTTWRMYPAPEAVLPGAPWCQTRNTATWFTANWGAEMVFDMFILAFTLIRLRQMKGADNGSSRRMRMFILRSNLGYFIISFVLSLSAFVCELVVANVILSQVMTPPAVTLTPVVAIRIIFSATNDATIEDSRPYWDDSRDPTRMEKGQITHFFNQSDKTEKSRQQQPTHPDDEFEPKPTAKEAQDLADLIYRANHEMPTYQIQTVSRRSPPDHAASPGTGSNLGANPSMPSKAAKILQSSDGRAVIDIGGSSQGSSIHKIARVPIHSSYDAQSFQRTPRSGSPQTQTDSTFSERI